MVSAFIRLTKGTKWPMARYDKYDSENSGFRATLGANLVLTNPGGGVAPGIGPVAVSLDANGRVLVGGPNNSGLCGVLVKNMPAGALVGNAFLTPIGSPGTLAGDAVDVMTYGEITDVTGLVAGTTYWADGTTGALAAAQAGGAAPATGSGSTAGSIRIGWTVEATRLIVRIGFR